MASLVLKAPRLIGILWLVSGDTGIKARPQYCDFDIFVIVGVCVADGLCCVSIVNMML